MVHINLYMDAGKYLYTLHLKSFKYDFYIHLKIVHFYLSHKAAKIQLPGEWKFIYSTLNNSRFV